MRLGKKLKGLGELHWQHDSISRTKQRHKQFGAQEDEIVIRLLKDGVTWLVCHEHLTNTERSETAAHTVHTLMIGEGSQPRKRSAPTAI